AGDQRIPLAAPQHLDDVPARAAENALELLNDLAIAADWPVEALQIAVDDEDQIVQLLAPGERNGSEGFRLVRLSIAEKGPDLARRRVRMSTEVEIFQKPSLIDGHQRPKTHRHGRKLPELRHQPRVRIGGQALAVDLLSEIQELVLSEAALEKGSRVNARRGVSLNVNEITAVMRRWRMPEMHEADVVERSRRLEARNVTAKLGGMLVRPQHDGKRVPANERTNSVLDRPVTRMRSLSLGRERIEIRRVRRIGHGRAPSARSIEHLLQQVVRAFGPFDLDHTIKRIEPFFGLRWIGVRIPHVTLPCV